MSSLEPTSVGVLVADDQEVFLGVARDVVAATPGFDWLGGAASGEEAVVAAETLKPDLVLLDVRMPGIGGVEAARRITERRRMVVVLISVEDRVDIGVEAESSGAAALIGKQQFGPSMLRQLWARYGAAPGQG